MRRSDHERAIGLAMLESCGFLSLPRWPRPKALPGPQADAPPPQPPSPPRPLGKTDGTA